MPLGLCPECLIKAGFNTGTEPGGESAGFDPPPVARLAELFPQLEIIEFIGKGGMGAVYKARQPALDRFVALKILSPRGEGGPGFEDRFNREGRALAKLAHPNIVAVHDFGQAGGLHYLVMEFVDGSNLREVERAGRLSPEQAVAIVPQICEALQFAHNEGVVHRDIKPENILLDKKGRVKITDFGIAKILGVSADSVSLTGAKDVIGTPHYMAPEQIESPARVDHRADIFSLGVVFYEMLTGELPLGKFAPPSNKVQMDVRLDEVVLHALEKEPARRYQHVSEVKTRVETIANTPADEKQRTSGTAVVPPVQRPDRFWRRFAVVMACVMLIPMLIAILGLLMAIFIPAFQKARSQAQTGHARELAREGWQLWQEQKLDQAAAKFNEAVRFAPGDADAWNGLGWAEFNSGKTDEGASAFRTAVGIEPNHPGALNGLGQIYLSRGNYDQAEQFLLKAAPQAPAAWFGLARLYLLKGDFAQAGEWAQKLVRKMLDAAKEKHLNEGLRLRIQPQATNTPSGSPDSSRVKP